MDAQDRDEGKIRRRDEALARRFGKALDQVNPGAAVACPDPEIVAAYAEQSLHPDELEQWESHFAKCARCRKILRVLAAAAAAPLAEKEVAQLGELVSAAHAPVEITANSAGRTRRRLVDWRTRWLVPALGVAAVLTVWLAMRPPWRETTRYQSNTLIAQGPKEQATVRSAPAAPMDRLSNAAPLLDEKTKASPAPDRLSAKAPTVNSPLATREESRADAGNAVKKAEGSDGLATSVLQKEEKFRNPSAQLDVVTPSAPAPPAAVPPAKPAQETPAAAPPPPEVRFRANATAPPAPVAAPAKAAPGTVNQTVTVTEAAPVVDTTNGTLEGTIQQGASAELPVNGRNFQALAKSLPAREFLVMLKAPSGSTLWRAGKSGILERSTDAGKTWAAQESPAPEDWLAGAAVSAKASWLVGSHGAIARTTDGSHWKKVNPPAAAADASGAFPDWLAVTATNKNSATIVAGDGRKFATSDGGKAWRPQ
jgi:hypothetical protein